MPAHQRERIAGPITDSDARCMASDAISADMDGQLMPCPRRVSRADPVVLARNDRHRSTSRGPDLPRVAAGWSTASVRPSARR